MSLKLPTRFINFSDNVIKCEFDSIKLLHSICTYTNIAQNEEYGYGGSIYFKCNSSIVQDRFCSIKCYTPGYGKHSYVDVQTKTNKNFINLSLLYQCGYDDTGWASISHWYGDQTLISTNNTNTRCYGEAGYMFWGHPVNVNFCCFISNDNHESDIPCMEHNGTPDSFVKKSIFKNNSVKIEDNPYGLLESCSSSSNVTVSECIFIGNNAKYTFCSLNSVLTVINCTGNLSASYKDAVLNTDKAKTDSFNLTLSRLSLGKCEAEYPFPFDIILFVSKRKRKLYFRFNFTLPLIFVSKK